MNGVISNIQHFSLHDGPGIRTTIFLKGCPLNCRWCQNPEGLNPKPELLFDREKCINCGDCIALCPAQAIRRVDQKITISSADCIHCGDCAKSCPTEALEMVGEAVSSDELIKRIAPDATFFEESGGGVTLSGGEPLSQSKFAAELLKKCKELGFHTAVDTSGYADWSAFERVLPYTDLFLFDLKQADNDVHMAATEVSNEPILRNLRNLAERGANILGRFPVVPGISNSVESALRIGEILYKNDVKTLHVLPHHTYGVGKTKRMVRPHKQWNIPPLDKTEQNEIVAALSAAGLNVIIGG